MNSIWTCAPVSFMKLSSVIFFWRTSASGTKLCHCKTCRVVPFRFGKASVFVAGAAGAAGAGAGAAGLASVGFGGGGAGAQAASNTRLVVLADRARKLRLEI